MSFRREISWHPPNTLQSSSSTYIVLCSSQHVLNCQFISDDPLNIIYTVQTSVSTSFITNAFFHASTMRSIFRLTIQNVLWVVDFNLQYCWHRCIYRKWLQHWFIELTCWIFRSFPTSSIRMFWLRCRW